LRTIPIDVQSSRSVPLSNCFTAIPIGGYRLAVARARSPRHHESRAGPHRGLHLSEPIEVCVAMQDRESTVLGSRCGNQRVRRRHAVVAVASGREFAYGAGCGICHRTIVTQAA